MASKCDKGKSCGATCINGAKECISEIPGKLSASIKVGKKSILDQTRHIAEHLSEAAVAWKIGKTVGPFVSTAIQNKFGIPREVSETVAESLVQALSSVAIQARRIEKADEFVEKLLVEFTAAFAGKVSHSSLDNALSSEQFRQAISTYLPILAGKAAGIGSATVGYRLPAIKSMSRYIAGRYKSDSQLLLNLIQSRGRVSFSESPAPGQSLKELVSLLTVVSLLYYYYENP